MSMSGMLELLIIRELGRTHLVGARYIEPTPSENICDGRGKILVEIEAHSTRTNPGYLSINTSAVSAAFSSTSRSTSLG